MLQIYLFLFYQQNICRVKLFGRLLNCLCKWSEGVDTRNEYDDLRALEVVSSSPDAYITKNKCHLKATLAFRELLIRLDFATLVLPCGAKAKNAKLSIAKATICCICTTSLMQAWLVVYIQQMPPFGGT